MHTQFNQSMQIELFQIGKEKIPVFLIENFALFPENLIECACQQHIEQTHYQYQKSDFYPGIRKPVPESYSKQINNTLLPILTNKLNMRGSFTSKTILSAFSITVTPANQLKPIQMVPHFDSSASNQYAVVHYLCDQKHGGTSFYRHKKTEYERITQARLNQYGTILKEQAQAKRLHENPQYIHGSNDLFEQTFSVDASRNRAIIYPSNALHSGNISALNNLSANPAQGRLTISSFILINENTSP